MPDHAMDHGGIDPADTACNRGLVLAAEPAVAHEPGEGAFHDPAFREHSEGGLASELGYDLEHETPFLGRPILQPALIAGIRKNSLHARKAFRVQAAEQGLGTVAVLHVGRMHRHGPDQAERVDEEVPLASRDPLARVKAPAPPLFSATRTDWLSTIMAEGVLARPALRRT